MSVTLRAAAAADCEQVYAWNFAPDVRAMSGDRTTVSLAQHTAWYAQRIAAGHMWIVLAGDAPVGVVRIDGNARMSIALDAAARGHGVGPRAIAAACAAWARPVVAQIRHDNLPSRAAFEACGFTAADSTRDLVTYTWRP